MRSSKRKVKTSSVAFNGTEQLLGLLLCFCFPMSCSLQCWKNNNYLRWFNSHVFCLFLFLSYGVRKTKNNHSFSAMLVFFSKRMEVVFFPWLPSLKLTCSPLKMVVSKIGISEIPVVYFQVRTVSFREGTWCIDHVLLTTGRVPPCMILWGVAQPHPGMPVTLIT